MLVTSSVVSDRKRELTAVRHALEKAAAGAPSVVCVEGRAGMGKTAVLAEARRMARELGFRVFSSQCSVVRPQVVEQLFDGAVDHEAMHRLVHEVSLAAPVLLAVDDVEQADSASLNFLSSLRRLLGGLPVAIVVTRGLVVDATPLLRDVIGDARRIQLTGLDQPACARFLRTIFTGGVTDEVVADWRAATCGNPYLLGLRSRELGERSSELVARLAQAGPQVVALARSFAVLGEADLALAGAAAGLGAQEAATASRALSGLGFAGVPMVLTTLAQSTTALDRAAIHARAARFRHDEQAPVEDVAAHLLQATPIGEDWVRDVLRIAARRSTPDRAIAFLRRLLREPLPDDVRGEVLVQLSGLRSALPRRDLIDQFSFAHRIVALIGTGDYEQADRQCEEALRMAAGRDLAVCAAMVQGLRCHVARRLGTLAEAERLGMTSLERLDALGANEDGAAVITVAGLVGAWVDTGDTMSALRLVRERELDGDLPEYTHYQALLHQRGRLHMALGDPAAALRDQLDYGHRAQRRGPSLHPWRAYAALAHLALGQRDHAVRLAVQELELARDQGLAVPLGVALRVSGVVTGSAALAEEAVSTLRTTPARLELARALVDWGVVLRGQEALAALRQGHDLAKRCGAIPLMGLAARELRAAGGRPARSPSGSVLTSQEEHIVRRAVHGLTNRQIAAELFVTPRAVELHLTRAYRKLGISGRRDLAAALAKVSA